MTWKLIVAVTMALRRVTVITMMWYTADLDIEESMWVIFRDTTLSKDLLSECQAIIHNYQHTWKINLFQSFMPTCSCHGIRALGQIIDQHI